VELAKHAKLAIRQTRHSPNPPFAKPAIRHVLCQPLFKRWIFKISVMSIFI
jgi:hypothetical protein